MFIASAVVSLIVGIYGLYANNKRDKRIKYLEEKGMTARVEGETLVFDKIK